MDGRRISAASFCSGVALQKLHQVQIRNPLPAYTCIRPPLVARAKKQNMLRLFCSTTAVLCIAVGKACDSSSCGEPTLETSSSFHLHLPIPHASSFCVSRRACISQPFCYQNFLIFLSFVSQDFRSECLESDAVLPASNFPIQCRWSSWQPPKYESLEFKSFAIAIPAQAPTDGLKLWAEGKPPSKQTQLSGSACSFYKSISTCQQR